MSIKIEKSWVYRIWTKKNYDNLKWMIHVNLSVWISINWIWTIYFEFGRIVFVPNYVTVAHRKYLINYLSVQIFDGLDLKWNTQIVYQMFSENSQLISKAYFNYFKEIIECSNPYSFKYFIKVLVPVNRCMGRVDRYRPKIKH